MIKRHKTLKQPFFILFLFALGICLTAFDLNDSGPNRTRDFTIIPGLGVRGLIEIGKTVKENEALIGKGIKGKEDTWGGCIRIKGHRWEEYIAYSEYGIRAYIDRYDYSKRKKDLINWIDFDSTFVGGLENGIRIGQATRKEVYAIYGDQKYDNPGVEYDSLGIAFLFDKNWDEQDHSADLLIRISVFPVEIGDK